MTNKSAAEDGDFYSDCNANGDYGLYGDDDTSHVLVA